MALLCASSALPAFASPSGVVISAFQVRGTAGASDEFVELRNTGATPVSISGWKLQGCANGSPGNASDRATIPASVTLQAGQYYLLANSGYAGAVTPDQSWGATGVSDFGATSFAGIQVLDASSAKQDGVGAPSSPCREGTGITTPGSGASFAFARTQETDNNTADFSGPQAYVPHNSSSGSTATLSINDVSVAEGDAGSTLATFTVSLSQPAGTSGVTFDIATADGTASAGSDYVVNSLTSQTIPAGSTTYSFDVTVNGDVAPEANETFFVNVTNVTGATVADGQGQGTIIDNDAPHLSIADVSHNEGNAGTTSYVFTVSLTQPAGASGVSFDIATADASATAPSDYTSASLTGLTIPAGATSAIFTVLVNGDTTTEADETFNVNVTNVVNASVDDAQAVGTIVNDDITITKIHDVQGNGAATPIPGQTVTVEGVVTAEFLGSAKLSGFFLQEEDADFDADPNTSEGIFVFCTPCAAGSVVEGQRVRVTGVVSEFFNMTELTPASPAGVVVTDAGNHLAEVTPVTVSLPVVGNIDAFYEPREAMLVAFADTLSISEFFELPRYGQIELLQGGRSRTFTEDNAPSVAGLAAHLDGLARRRVILDDDNNVQNSVLTQPNGQQALYWPHQNGGFGVGTQGADYFRGGDTISGLTGVLHWSFAGLTGTDAWRVRPTTAHPVTFTPVNTRPATPPDVGGAIKVVGMNLLNYFTTIDTTSSSSSGPCGPSGTLDCRGADSNAELIRQRERASIVVCTLNPDVAGFMELENTTPSDTITDLLGAINTRCGGTHPYAFANTGGTLGTDAIRVQIVYRTGVVSPVGSPLVDLDPIHDRPPTAQTFDVVDAANQAFGERFTVIANHFKSKGSCPSAGDPNADQGDGQGCWAVKRTAQANRLMSWISSTVVPAAGDPDVLLLGDFNSYAQETPVTTLAAGGYADMETVLHGTNAYSYQFDGELGHLDYAFANPSMQSQVTGADAWHINADEVPSFDYNDEIRDTGEAAQEEKPDGSALVPPRVVFQPATPYRASDHDPVVVGLFPTVVTHTVTSSVGTPAGTITPPSATVNDGATTQFTLVADAGFHIDTVGGTCPAGSLAGNTYTTGAIIADCTVVANFAADVVTHTVTAVVGTPAGTITPPSATVNDGATTAFTVTADAGFHIDTVTGCGGTLAANTYTTGPITSDCTVTANFAADGGSNGVIHSAALNHTIAETTVGTSLNIVTSALDDAGPISGDWDFNFWASGGNLTGWKIATHNAQYLLDGTGKAAMLQNGAVVDGSGTFTTGTGSVPFAAEWLAGGNGALGVKFDCDGRLTFPVPSTVCYGFVRINSTGTHGFPAVIVDTTFDGDGNAITVSGIPANNPPAATVTPTTLSFTVAANATATQTLNIANAAGSDALTYAITGQASRAARLIAHTSKSRKTGEVLLRSHGGRMLRAGAAVHAAPAPWSPVGPDGSFAFQADDGSYENGIAWTDAGGTTQNTSLWLNRYAATGPMTIDTVSIEWPGATAAAGDVTGKSVNLVAYFDADSDGDPSNATRLGSNTPITINGPDAFETYPTNFVVPAAGDVYLGFVDTFAAGGTTPVLYSASLDTEGDPNVGWVAAMSTGDADVDVIGNNDNIGTLDGLSGGSLAGVWMVRGTGTGTVSACAGAVVNWLSANPASGSVTGGANTNVTITANPSADSLAPGSYTGMLCIATNDPTQALIGVPVSLTVTEAPFVPCSAADEIFCDGFDPAAPATVITGTINQPAVANGDGSSFDFALEDFHGYDSGITTDDINLYTLGAPAISVYWYGDLTPPEVGGLTGGVVGTSGGTDFVVLHSGDVIGPASPVSAASQGADMSAFEAGVNGYIGVAFYNEVTSTVNYGYLHVQTSAGGFPIQVLDYGYDNSGAAITIP